MILRQFILDDLASAAYLVGDANAGVAAMVDPHLDVQEYLDAAEFFGVEIRHVLETHSHADRVSGHGRLAELGATIHIHSAAEVSYPHKPFEDGWVLELGDVQLAAMHTPGHRPEHTAFVLTDRSRGPEAWAVLTGDSLFVSDVARPDLAVEAESGAQDLFKSLHDGLLTLPPETEVWPGHIGGSLCGGPGMDLKTSTTVGYERAHNPLLGLNDLDRFVELTTSDLPPHPANFERIVGINSGDFVSFPESFDALAPEQVSKYQAEGALVVDARSGAEFDEAHIPGAVSIPAAGGGFANRLAWLAKPNEHVVIVGTSDKHGQDLCQLAASVGIETVAGYLAGGFPGWTDAGMASASTPTLAASQLRQRMSADPAMVILDVRERREMAASGLPESQQIPYHELRDVSLDDFQTSTVAVICTSGGRAGVGASLLLSRGLEDVIHITDGGVPDLLGTSNESGH